jgi:2-phosphoglycerate kinase
MNEMVENKRSWDVLIIGGASGTGKTSASYALAHHFGVGIMEVDDLHIMAERMTTPEQQPLLHYWRTNPEASRLSARQILELHIAVSRVLSPAIRAVIANHLETRTPIVLEGDYLLPEILAPSEPERSPQIERVSGVFIFEPDEGQIHRNFAAREPDEGDQAGRARVSWLFGQWLKDSCQRFGLPAIASRPWDSLQERIKETVT